MECSAYELQRKANIAANEAKLASLGLLRPTSKRSVPAVKQSRSTTKKKSGDPDYVPKRSHRQSTRFIVKGADAFGKRTDVLRSSDDESEDDIPLPKRAKGRDLRATEHRLALEPERKHVETCEAQVEAKSEAPFILVELAKTGRSKCRGCMGVLNQGEERVGMESWMVGRRVMAWQHPQCFAERMRIMLEETGRGKCKATGKSFAVGERKVALTAHTTTACLKLDAAATLLAPLRSTLAAIEIEGLELLLEEEKGILFEAKVKVSAEDGRKSTYSDTRDTVSPGSETSEAEGGQPAKGIIIKAKGRVCWRFAGHLCYGNLLPKQESKTHCYARTHKGNIKTLAKGSSSWWVISED